MAESMRLVFAGDIRFDQLTAAVENAFSDWSGGKAYPENTIAPYPASKKQNRSHLLKNPVFPYDRPSPPDSVEQIRTTSLSWSGIICWVKFSFTPDGNCPSKTRTDLRHPHPSQR